MLAKCGKKSRTQGQGFQTLGCEGTDERIDEHVEVVDIQELKKNNTLRNGGVVTTALSSLNTMCTAAGR